MFDIKEHSVQKWEKLSLSRGFVPDFYVTFHVIWFLNTNKDVMKIIENNNFFSKVTNLQCADWNFTLKRHEHRLMRIIWEKNVYDKPLL